MRILDRLITTSFLKLFMAFVLGSPLLFVLADATENLDRYLDRGIAFQDVAYAYLYQMPQFIVWAFPIAALLATVFTVHSMTVHREVMAAKAGGISFHRLVAPLLILGVILTGVALALSDQVPEYNRKAAEILEGRDTSRMWRSNFVFQTDAGYALTIQRLTVDERRMQGVVAERIERDEGPVAPAASEEDGDAGVSASAAGRQEANGAAPRRGTYVHMVADDALYDEEKGWTFRNGYYRKIQNGEVERAFEFDSLRVRGLADHPEALMEEPRDEDEMTYAELGRLAESVYRSGGDPGRLLVKREQKLAVPVATLVIILFGAPLATSSKRGGTAFGVGVSLGTTILYLLLFRVAGAFGQSGALDPLLSAWLPNLVFLVAGTILMARVRT